MLRYPNGGLTGGKDITTLTSHIDMLPTFIDYLNLKKGLPQKALDGVSLVPLFEGKDVSWADRTVIVDSQRNTKIAKWKKTSVMSGKWRLVNGEELYDISKDKTQAKNIAASHPDIVKKLTADYDAWWEEIAVKEDVNNRYAYIVAGGAENPVRATSHDMQGHTVGFYEQESATLARSGRGIFKIGIEKDGKYKFSLCRYPLESGLKFNSKFDAIEPTNEVPNPMPASVDVVYKSVVIKIGEHSSTEKVDMNASSVDFEFDMKAGRYDLNTFFVDAEKNKYPPYYFYIEKLD